MGTPIVEMAIDRLKDVESNIKKLADERSILKQLIDSVRQTKSYKDTKTYIADPSMKITTDPRGYEHRWSLNKKIQYVLGIEKRPMTSSEITAKLIELDPQMGEDEKKNKLVKDVSTILSIGYQKIYDRKKNSTNPNYLYSVKKASLQAV